MSQGESQQEGSSPPPPHASIHPHLHAPFELVLWLQAPGARLLLALYSPIRQQMRTELLAQKDIGSAAEVQLLREEQEEEGGNDTEDETQPPSSSSCCHKASRSPSLQLASPAPPELPSSFLPGKPLSFSRLGEAPFGGGAPVPPGHPGTRPGKRGGENEEETHVQRPRQLNNACPGQKNCEGVLRPRNPATNTRGGSLIRLLQTIHGDRESELPVHKIGEGRESLSSYPGQAHSRVRRTRRRPLLVRAGAGLGVTFFTGSLSRFIKI